MLAMATVLGAITGELGTVSVATALVWFSVSVTCAGK